MEFRRLMPLGKSDDNADFKGKFPGRWTDRRCKERQTQKQAPEMHDMGEN